MLEIDTQKTRKILMNMLREIDDICKKYDITYYAAGGTALGAVRHKGFIPWDDDADIYMTRDEFVKFKKAFHIEKPNSRHLSCIENNPKYPAVIPRYIDDNTTFITRSAVLDSFPAGYVIDIFILDPLPADDKSKNEYINLMYIYNDFIMPFYVFSTRCSDEYLPLYHEYKEREKTEGRSRILAELEEKLFSYKEEDCPNYALRWGSCPQIFDKTMMGTPVYFPFEDMEIPLPERYYDYLVQLYGVDWMNMPEDIEEQGHVAVINPDKPYSAYFEQIESMVDQDNIYKNLMDRKNFVIATEIERRPYIDLMVSKQIEYVKIALSEKLKDENPEQLVSDRKYDRLKEIFGDLINLQLSDACVGKLNHAFMRRYHNPILIDLSTEQYIIAAKTILHSRGIDKAKKYISLLEQNNINSKDIEQFKHYILQVDKLIQAYNLKNYNEANQIIDSLPNNIDFSSLHVNRISCLIKVDENGDSTNPDLLYMLEEKYAQNNKDIQIKKAIGDYYYNIGEKNVALPIYEEVAESSRNVFILNDLSKKLKIDTLNIEKNNRKTPKHPHTENGKMYYKLLKEVDKICRDNKINYTLAGRTLWAGKYYGVFDDEDFPPNIAMTAENADKFISSSAKELPENRAIKHPGNDVGHEKYSIHYYNTNTAFLDLLNPKKEEGLYIEISILRQRDKRSILRYAERAAEVVNYQIDDDNKIKKLKRDRLNIIYSSMSVIKFLFGGKKFKERHFRHYIKNIQNGDGNYYEVGRGVLQKAMYYMPARVFSSYSSTKVYNHEFMTVNDIDTYFANWIEDDSLDKIKSKKRELVPRYISNTTLSTRELKDLLDFDLSDRKKWDEYEDAVDLQRGGRRRRLPFQRAYDLLNLTDARFKLAQRYILTKESILEAYNAKEYKYLEKELKDYDVEAKEYVKKKMGLCFDREIFDIYVELLNEKGQKSLARKIKRFLPKEHRRTKIEELV